MALDVRNGEIQIDASVSVVRGAPPQANTVFVSINDTGVPGQLNQAVLGQLGLDADNLPNQEQLAGGYYVRPEGDFQICFVVTIGLGASSGANLKANLDLALSDSAIVSSSSVWIPLMATGAGGMSLAASLDMTLTVLNARGYFAREGSKVTISAPPDLTAKQVSSLQNAISAFRARVGLQEEPAADQQARNASVEDEKIPGTSIPENLSSALLALLELASGLRATPNSRLSTTLSLFALMEGRRLVSSFAPGTDERMRGLEPLLRDRPLALFANAIAETPQSNRDQAWASTFKSKRSEPQFEMMSLNANLTENMRHVLGRATSYAAAQGRDAIETDDFIEAFCSLEEGRFQKVLDTLGTSRQALIEAYRDMRVGTISEQLHNDLAASADMLDYENYADAIARFLIHAKTPPPLSISIQAPWGAGKSSLMNLIRAKLDPALLKAVPKVASTQPGLAIEDVLTFLDGSKADVAAPQEADKADFATAARWRAAALLGRFRLSASILLGRSVSHIAGPTAPSEHPSHPDTSGVPKSGARLTIWFNAWKYETSEQIWAGLVDAIVSQMSERLSPFEREKFLLRLHLSRIDDGIVRKKIYDRIASRWWASVKAWALATGGFLASFLGLGLWGHTLGSGQPEAILPNLIVTIASFGAPASAILLVAGVFSKYQGSADKTKKEPAAFSLTEYLTVPNYNVAIGQIHQIHADLRRVLAKVPSITAGVEHDPIVIFIDDLDRCSPGKIANVVEGVSMLLASDTFRCMFVIGMDPQMVAAALEKAHEEVRNQLPPYEQAVPLGWRFMDKFVQLPFTIPPSRKDRLDNYLVSLGGAPSSPPPKASPAALTPAATSLDEDGEGANPTFSVEATEADDSGSAVTTDVASPPTSTDETRDVGRIIRRVAAYTAGNPREAKRMVNLARLYLLLRNTRSAAERQWNPPDLDQYARWIALTLRWPDMMRWLQWGSDEVSWGGEDSSQELVVRRLQRLEKAAECAPTMDKWQSEVADQLGLGGSEKISWLRDRKLFDFFRAEAGLPAGDRISSAARTEFW